jgi:hypothetical protein
MYKKLMLLVVVVQCATLVSAQKLTFKDITGKWQVTSLVTDGQTIPVESDDKLRDYLYQQMVAEKEKTDSTNIVLTESDSSGVEMGIKMLAMFRDSDMIFQANRTFKFSLSIAGVKKDMAGTWAYNEAAKIIRLTELKKGKPVKSGIVKVLVKGNQLLLQMEKDKEEGFLLSKKK